ncbi:unnamed protein product [Trichogramma brassicae]|uniref:Uncharacterized protein n=2 Tax=Trichogramma TaxID=7490 RepID=A0A6H5IAI9_9HYME|nr:unnamed protein product [Trichogramma brassicae]
MNPKPSRPPDCSDFNIVQATQYGALERVQELVEAGYDVNEPDAETVTLLHWAAINNRKEIVKYFIAKGAKVDAIGGELASTPLHWATSFRSSSSWFPITMSSLRTHWTRPTLRPFSPTIRKRTASRRPTAKRSPRCFCDVKFIPCSAVNSTLSPTQLTNSQCPCQQDQKNSYYHTTDMPPVLNTDKYADKGSAAATKFWARIFGLLHIGTSFVIAFVLQLLRFVLFSLVRPLTIGVIQLLSDYFLKPLLTIIFNGFLQPFLILFYNIATSFRDCCEPLAAAVGFYIKELAVLFRACRLVEVNQYPSSCNTTETREEEEELVEEIYVLDTVVVVASDVAALLPAEDIDELAAACCCCWSSLLLCC